MYLREESLITKAKSSKKLPNFVWGTVLVLLIMFAGQMIGGICLAPVYFFLNIFSSNGDLIILFISIMADIFVLLLIFIRVKFIEKRKISTLGFAKENWLKKYAKGFLVGFAMMASVVGILFLYKGVKVETNPIQPVGVKAIGGVLFILIGWIVQGATEEIVTRGWFMNVIGARYNATFALILSSSVFGILHLLNPQVSIIAVINIILVGFFYGIYVMKSNDLWVVCGMHTAWNFAQGNIFGFEVSGINVEVSTLFDLKLVGNDIITGGSFGVEGGLIATLVLIASIFILLKLDKIGYLTK